MQRLRIVRGARLLRAEEFGFAITRRVPRDEPVAGKRFELAEPAGRARADAMQEDQRLARAGLAIGDGFGLPARKLVDALIEVHRSRILQQMTRSAEIVGGGFAGLAAA